MKATAPRRSNRIMAIALTMTFALPGALPTGAAQTPGERAHQAPRLEATLPPDLPGAEGRTRSFAGTDAVRDWGESYLERYILATTCRSVSDLEYAEVDGYVVETESDPFPPGVEAIERYAVSAIRFTGADPALVREGYLQARRFVGPPADGGAESHPYAFAGRPGWRPAEITIGGRSVVRYLGDDSLHAYVVHDTIYEVKADDADVPLLLAALPSPGAPAVGANAETDASCEGPDPELRELVIGMRGGHELDPYPMPPGLVFHEEVAHATRDPGRISGYLIGVSLGGLFVAYRVPGAKRRALERACLRLLDIPRKAARVVDWGGRRVRYDRRSESACYVRGEMLFAFRGRPDAKRLIRSIPPDDGRESSPSQPARTPEAPS